MVHIAISSYRIQIELDVFDFSIFWDVVIISTQISWKFKAKRLQDKKIMVEVMFVWFIFVRNCKLSNTISSREPKI
jgi:hypothetical protein